MPPVGYTKRRARWTREDVIEALRAWQGRYGAPPTAADWNPADAMRGARRSTERAFAWASRAARFSEGEWPWTGTVSKLFGGWNAALEAAGLDVRYQRSDTPVPATAPALDDLVTAVKAARGESRRTALLALAARALELADADR
jgi:hypothetical protein